MKKEFDRNARFSKKINQLAKQRLVAIDNKDLVTATQLSKKINDLGCLIVDTPRSYVLIRKPKQSKKQNVTYPNYIIEIADVVDMAWAKKDKKQAEEYVKILKDKGFIINKCWGGYTLQGTDKNLTLQFENKTKEDNKSNFSAYVIELADLVHKLDKMGYQVIDTENDYIVKQNKF